MKEFTVLLVEGRSSVAGQLRSLFQQTPYQLELSDNRDAALRQLSVLKPHLLLLGALEPGDDIALGAAAEIAGIPTLSATREPERLLERLKAILEPHSKKTKLEVNAPLVVDQRRLDKLAVALADEISDQGDSLDVSAKPEESRRSMKESSSGSDGVTQILGLLEMNKEDDSGVSRMGKPHDANKHQELKSGPSPADSSGELSASLFALAVGSGKEGPIVTRVAKPLLEVPKEEAPLESAIFTPPEIQKDPPRLDKTPKTKNLGGGPPSEPPKKVETPLKLTKEETRRIFAPNLKEANKPKADPLDEILSFGEKNTPIKREAPPTRNQTPAVVAAQLPEARSQPPRNAPAPTPVAAPVSAPSSQLSGLPLSPTPWSEEPQVVRSARLLHELLLQKERGVVTSKAGALVRTLSVSGGVVLQATSNVPEEQFAFILYREGKLTRAQLDEIRLMGEGSGEEVAKTIYKKGYARRTELEAARRRHREEIFAGLLEGACDFQQREVGLPAPQEKPFAATLVAALRRRLSTQEARALLQDATLHHSACPTCSRELLGLSPQELMLLQRINGQTKIAELMGGVSQDLALPLLVALEVAGLVQIAARAPKEDENQQELLIERGRIEGKYEEVILADYFTLLGVSRRATLYEIEKAHQALSQAFHPERFQSPQYADLLPRLAEIQDVLSDALFVLSDEATRSSYALHLVE